MSWRHRKFKANRNVGGRITVLSVFFIILALAVMIKLFSLQILSVDYYNALASGQHELYQKLFPERGSIYVSEEENGKKTLFPLVTNQEEELLYAVPKEIENPEETAKKLIEIIGPLAEEQKIEEVEKQLFADISPDLDPKLVSEIKENRRVKWREEQTKKEMANLSGILANKELSYKPIKHRLTKEETEKIKNLNIKGLYFKSETWRFYPESGVGGQVFGFWGFEGDNRVGRYGLEGYFDDILSGKFGELYGERDALGNIIAVGKSSIKEKVDGSDLVLTLDRAIQYKACQSLYQAVDYFKAQGGSVVVMEPKTGAILAMCGAPDFNPDKYGEAEDMAVYNNPAIFSAYEPGSVFKMMTMAAAIDTDKVQPETVYEDTGQVVIGPDEIKNYNDKIYGRQNMVGVLDNSINTGAIFAMRQTGRKVFAKYVKDFGFGELSGIELDKEVKGDISNLDKRGEIYPATASFGQGITVTPIQLAAAYSAIANGGKLMRPYIVSQIVSPSGEAKNFLPQETRRVISSKTALMLSGMMVSVVENGHGAKAAVSGYRVAGKTGTAQVAKKNGVGYSDEVTVTFAGFAPFSNPRFTMVVMIDRPQWGKEAAVISAPIFADIAKFILQYYNVAYDK